MREDTNNAPPLEGTGSRVAVMMLSVLAGIAALCGLLIVSTFQLTEPIIRRNQAEFLQRSIFEVLPSARQVRTFELSGGELIPLAGEASGDEVLVYATRDEHGRFNGVALEAAGQGYQDTITVLYGYKPDAREIVGMKVLASKETPGLGDKIELDENFRKNFLHLDARLDNQQQGLAKEIVTVKQGAKVNPWEIDGITGATISSKAIGRILNESANLRLPVIVSNLDVLETVP